MNQSHLNLCGLEPLERVKDLRQQLQSLNSELIQLQSDLNQTTMGPAETFQGFSSWREESYGSQACHFQRSLNGSITHVRSALLHISPPPLPPRLNRPNRCHWSDEPAAEEKISAGKQFHSNLDLSYPTTSRHSDISANFFQPKPIALPPKPTNFDRNGTGQCRTACPLETVKGSSSSVKQGSLVQTNGTLYSNRISTVGKLLVNESKHNSNKLFPTSSEPKSDTEIFEINTCRNRNVTDGFELLDLTDSEADEQFVTSITTESSECWFKIGSTLLFVNRLASFERPGLLIDNSRDSHIGLKNLSQEILERLTDGLPSISVIFNGESGSGKSTISRRLLEQLFLACNRSKGISSTLYQGMKAGSDVVKYFTTTCNTEYGVRGHVSILYELSISQGEICRAKLSCCFPDLGRLVSSDASHSNFFIFYLLIYGLSTEEKNKFHLQGYSESDFIFLRKEPHEVTGREKQELWHLKSCLTLLGIPLSDVFRVLSAILLLGNVSFENDLDRPGKSSKQALDAVSALLGVTTVGLTQALLGFSTTLGPGKSFSMINSNPKPNIDSLAKTLFYRCITAIVRRANSHKVSSTTVNSPHSNTSSSDESSHPDSGIGLISSSIDKIKCNSIQSCLPAESSIAILDSFGIRDNKRNHFEEFCVNLAAEKLQHCVRQKLIDEILNQIKLEEITCDLSVTNSSSNLDEQENFVQIFSSRFGLLSLIDEASLISQPTFLDITLRKRFKDNKILRYSSQGLLVTHYDSYDIQYDIVDFPVINRDRLTTDLIKVFDRRSCNFGFVSYLFSPDLKRIEDLENSPRKQKLSFYPRIAPRCGSEFWWVTTETFSGAEHTTLAQDFHSRMNGFMKVTLAAEMVKIINCVRMPPTLSPDSDKRTYADLLRQVKRLQLLLISEFARSGFPYVEKFNQFNRRYRFLLSRYQRVVFRLPTSQSEESRAILDCFLKAVDESYLPYVSNHWLIGTASAFLSEGAYQQLEALRDLHRQKAAALIQLRTRKWLAGLKLLSEDKSTVRKSSGGRPLPIVGSHGETLWNSIILSPAQCNAGPTKPIGPALPLPVPRAYTIEGSVKLIFPQRRVMTQSYRVPQGSGPLLKHGDIVTAMGWSNISGHIMIELGPERLTYSVPHCITKLSCMARSANV